MNRAGISTACFYPETTERSLELAAASGTRCAEVFINAEQEFSPDFVRALGDRAKSLGVEIVSVHPYTSGFETMMFFSDYARRMEDGLERYRLYFDRAASLGARYFILHGAAKQTRMEDERIFERVGVLSRLARRCGVELLQENVSRCRSADPSFLRAMREWLGEEIRFVLDTKQAVRAGHEVMRVLGAMGGAVRHLHLSDCDAEHTCLPPGLGSADLPALIARLRDGGYEGDYIIELYNDSYHSLEQLYESHEYLAGLLAI